MNARMQDILDESLAAMLDRGESIADCIKRYPDAATELKPLLSLAARGQQALTATMPVPARSAVRKRIMAQALAQKTAPVPDRTPWSRFWPRRLAMRSLVVAGAIMLLGAGTAFAATQAGPDSLFYRFKTGMESARTTLAWQKLDQAAVETGNAGKRLDEISGMAAANKPEYIPGLLASYHQHIDVATRLVDEAKAEGEDAGEVEAMIAATEARKRQLMGEIEEGLTEEVREAIRGDLDEADDDDLNGETGDDDNDIPYPPAPSAPAPAGGYRDDDGDGYDDDHQSPPGGGDEGGGDDYPSGGGAPDSSEPDDGSGDDGEEDHPVSSSVDGDAAEPEDDD